MVVGLVGVLVLEGVVIGPVVVLSLDTPTQMFVFGASPLQSELSDGFHASSCATVIPFAEAIFVQLSFLGPLVAINHDNVLE